MALSNKNKIRLLLFTCFAAPLTGSAQELHYGIVLPDTWPPRYEVPASAREMPVPYLSDKPRVIPVNTGRQLFVDHFLIRGTTALP